MSRTSTEQQIRHWIVNPFLVALGWDPHDKKQVYFDFPVKGGEGHVDYALLDSEGAPAPILGCPRTTGTSPRWETSPTMRSTPRFRSSCSQTADLLYVSANDAPAPLFVLPLKKDLAGATRRASSD